ncbi:MAG: 4Fe-4S binding protein [Chthonomonadales bacterium]
MIVAIASGKGGTGKTLLSVSLARVLSRSAAVQYADCDVEEPNGHLFLKPDLSVREPIRLPIPRIDASLCSLCGECSSFCAFNALAVAGSRLLVFDELCHSCGGCALVCPKRAISWVDREIGVVEAGTSGPISFVHGRLALGARLVPPLIEAVRKRAHSHPFVIVDAPPGASCSVVAAVRGADLVLLVTEPTPFGLNDLEIAAELVRLLGLRAAVIMNRCGSGDDGVERFCEAHHLPIWERIPFDRRIAEAYSCGRNVLSVVPEFARACEALAAKIQSGAAS